MDSTTSPENIIALMGIILIPVIILTIFLLICMWKIFEKAGKPGWAAIVPIYNNIIQIEIAGKPIWWILLLIIPLVNIIFGIWILNLFCKAFGKDEGFTIGMILLPFIFIPILAFGSAKYIGPGGKPKQDFSL